MIVHILKEAFIKLMLLISKVVKTKGVPILLYHCINDHPSCSPVTAISLKTFEKQLQYLKKKGYKTISLHDLKGYVKGEILLPSKSVMITFDDGFQDNYNAIKLAKKYGFNAVLFMTTAYIGCELKYLPFIGEYSIDTFEQNKAIPGRVSFLTVDQLNELKKIGTEILPHTAYHRKLTSASYAEQKKEIHLSHRTINNLLGHTPTFFGYPYGEYNNDTKSILKDLEYQGAFAVIDGINRKGDDVFAFKRHNVSDFSLSYFALLLTEQYLWYRKIGKALRTIKNKLPK